jgi:regulator of protease activity HflC (stomatin/prohibitin superfamily)
MENGGNLFLLPIFITTMVFFFSIIILSSAIKLIPENKRIRIFRLGKYIGEKGPGIVMLIPIVDKGNIVEAISPQNIIQKQNQYSIAVAEAITNVYKEGKVKIGDEIVSAISKDPIPPGRKVRILHIIVEVEQLIQ